MSQNSPAVVAEMSNRNKILNLAIQGLTVQGISEATDLTEDTVRTNLTDIRAELSLRLQEAQENWIALNLVRMEKIISRIMPIFDVKPPVLDDESIDGQAKIRNYVGLIGDAAKVYTNVAKLQKEILQLKLEGVKGSSPSIVQNNTFIADSDFYQVALESIQIEGHGKTFEEYMEEAEQYVDVIPTLEEDDRLTKVEAKIDKLLPAPSENEQEEDA